MQLAGGTSTQQLLIELSLGDLGKATSSLGPGYLSMWAHRIKRTRFYSYGNLRNLSD